MPNGINLDFQLKGTRPPYFGVDSGSANTYVVTHVSGALGPSLRTGSMITFIAANANTGASTLQVLGGPLGPSSIIPITKSVSTALAANDILAGQAVEVLYDGTSFQLVGGAAGIGGGGGGGTPGGTNHEVQINSSGSFGGLATGTAGQYLRSGGASSDPAFASIAESEVTNLISDLALKAPLASPALTGTPTAPTAAGGTNTTQIATTAFVQAAVSSTNLVIGFVVNNGAAGSNVGPMLQAPRAGTVSKCVIVTKSSDGTTGLTFRIKKNGTDVFTSDPSVAAGTASGTTNSSTSLTSSPLSVAAGDVFQIDITSGSPNWAFTAQLET